MSRRHRLPRIVLTAFFSLLVCALIIAGDCFDIIPGYLTFPSVRTSMWASTQSVLSHGRQVAGKQLSAGLVTLPTGTPLAASYDSHFSFPPVNRNRLNKAITVFQHTKGLGSDYSFEILDPTMHELVGKNITTPREPASTTKTITALAAAAVLNMNGTLDTRVYLTGASGSGSRGSGSRTGTLVLRGEGDMLLGAGKNDPSHVDGRAGLATLAAQTAIALRRRSISSVRLLVDDRFFGPVRMPPHMDPSDTVNGLFTPTSALAIDEGKEMGSGMSAMSPDSTWREYAKRPMDTVTPAAASFAQSLSHMGIRVTAGQKGDKRVPSSTHLNRSDQIAVVHSAPLWQVLRFALHLSDNTIAEEFGRLVALHEKQHNSPSGGVAAVMSVVRRLGVDTNGIHLADCSGLSDGTRLTVTALTQAQYLYLHTVNAGAAEALAVSGLPDTTLVERKRPTAGNGFIRAKTGSLETVTSLAGTVERTVGGYVIFAIVVNNPANRLAARQGIDQLVTALASL